MIGLSKSNETVDNAYFMCCHLLSRCLSRHFIQYSTQANPSQMDSVSGILLSAGDHWISWLSWKSGSRGQLLALLPSWRTNGESFIAWMLGAIVEVFYLRFAARLHLYPSFFFFLILLLIFKEGLDLLLNHHDMTTLRQLFFSYF